VELSLRPIVAGRPQPGRRRAAICSAKNPINTFISWRITMLLTSLPNRSHFNARS